MEESDKISVNFSLREAFIICQAIASFAPPKEDEMVSFMLYARIKHKIEELTGKNEPL